MKQDSYKDKGDLMHILLHEDLYQGDDLEIAEECLTFFITGTQTTAIATQNFILRLI